MPVFVAKSIGQVSDSWVIAVGLCAVLGHVFSPWLGFRGGKGVATSAGILIGLTPWVALGVGIIWGVIFQFNRTVSVASLGAASVFPFLVFWINPHQIILQWAAIGLSGLVWIRHRDNLKRLFQGNENRFSKKDNLKL
jgi:glycerol-3-phosphate acyltransferase PlsY